MARRTSGVAPALCHVREVIEIVLMCFDQSWDVEWMIFGSPGAQNSDL